MSGTTYEAIAHSSFLDFTAYGLASDQNFNTIEGLPSSNLTDTQRETVAGVIRSAFYGASDTTVQVSAAGEGDSITIALALNRANDPTALLSGNWAERQDALADQASVATLYGADPATFDAVRDAVTGPAALSGLTDTDFFNTDHHVSTAESRTIWLDLTAEQFEALFDTELLVVSVDGNPDYYAWAGDLSLPTDIAASVGGVWIGQGAGVQAPETQNTDAVDPATLLLGAGGSSVLGEGNGAASEQNAYTPDIIAQLYDFPLSDAYAAAMDGSATEWQQLIASLSSPTIGLIESDADTTFQAYLNAYRESLGLPAYDSAATGDFAAVEFINKTDSSGVDTVSGETTLDVSIVAAAAPNSSQVMYSSWQTTLFTAYQGAIFDSDTPISILTSSYSDGMRNAPDSPFAWAYEQLFVDAQLRNITVLMASGDGGSSAEYAAGTPQVQSSNTVPTAIIVGGSSLSTYGTALSDETLESVVANARSNDVATLLQLIQGGLTTAPGNLDSTALQLFVETVWNEYELTTNNGSYEMKYSFLSNLASAGGIDTAQEMPSYQSEYGLSLDGRGVPDVSALAGGNLNYTVLNHEYVGSDSAPLTKPDGGTSAATPLWASLTAQLDVIFADQGLPELGYYNDLLYIAAAIAPGSFNDVTIGQNNSSFYYYHVSATDGPNGDFDDAIVAESKDGYSYILATNQGYSATDGYDLTTGLGTPDGLLLARALTAIAHTQMSGSALSAVVTTVDAVTAQSTADQTLLVQINGALGSYELSLGDWDYSGRTGLGSLVPGDAAVQKMLQSDFDPDLVTLLDGASHHRALSVDVAQGHDITAGVKPSSESDSISLGLYQSALTAQYGFVSFGGADTGVTVARPVAIAETPDDASDQEVVVRMRQSTLSDVSLMVYQVDDLVGSVEGLRPGEAGYAAAAERAAYATTGGGSEIVAPGFGGYDHTVLTGVDDGDILAMRITATYEGVTNVFWAFADANEMNADGSQATHLWSYGLNTWGWEDITEAMGSDQDFNDLIVQFDFTSLTGHDLIA